MGTPSELLLDLARESLRHIEKSLDYGMRSGLADLETLLRGMQARARLLVAIDRLSTLSLSRQDGPAAIAALSDKDGAGS